MRRGILALLVLAGLAIGYVLAHWAMIETAGEVIVLRTQEDDGGWLESRLWIVDDAGVAWLHGNPDSGWMRNLAARPAVEVVRGGATRQLRATPVPGPHPRIHELLRAKYGLADRWVRLVGADTASTTPVRLDPLDPPAREGAPQRPEASGR
jgi:hypothetical protein